MDESRKSTSVITHRTHERTIIYYRLAPFMKQIIGLQTKYTLPDLIGMLIVEAAVSSVSESKPSMSLSVSCPVSSELQFQSEVKVRLTGKKLPVADLPPVEQANPADTDFSGINCSGRDFFDARVIGYVPITVEKKSFPICRSIRFKPFTPYEGTVVANPVRDENLPGASLSDLPIPACGIGSLSDMSSNDMHISGLNTGFFAVQVLSYAPKRICEAGLKQNLSLCSGTVEPYKGKKVRMPEFSASPISVDIVGDLSVPVESLQINLTKTSEMTAFCASFARFGGMPCGVPGMRTDAAPKKPELQLMVDPSFLSARIDYEAVSGLMKTAEEETDMIHAFSESADVLTSANDLFTRMDSAAGELIRQMGGMTDGE